jgi:very-short-patch-repair endonuclease
MYRDLDPATWPKLNPLNKNPLICALLREGFPASDSLLNPEETEEAIRRLAGDCFVLDADSSQSLAIEEVRRGRNLVIQGPPGTGKSQTIANIIADSVRNGKRVLFVAEKLAALNVVKRRLDSVQLDGICLELHSNKASKRVILEEIKRTLSLGQPMPNGESSLMSSLEHVRADLDGHCERISATVGASGRSVFFSVGQLVKLASAGVRSTDLVFSDAPNWTPFDLAEREALVESLSEQIERYGLPADNPWRGIECKAVLPTDVERILVKVRKTKEAVTRLRVLLASLNDQMQLPASQTMQASALLLKTADAIVNAPDIESSAIASEDWQRLPEIVELVRAGLEWASEKEDVYRLTTDKAWSDDLQPTRDAIAKYGKSWFCWVFSSYRRARAHTRAIFAEMPSNPGALLELIDRVLGMKSRRSHINSLGILGRACFGALWDGANSNWEELSSVVRWAQNATGISPNLRALLGSIQNKQALNDALSAATHEHEAVQALLDDLFGELALNCEIAFNRQSIGLVPLNEMITRFQGWLEAREQLSKWIHVNGALRTAQRKGLGPIASRLWTGELQARGALGTFRFAYESSLMGRALAEHPNLGTFDGDQHSRVLSSYRSLDQATRSAARFQTAVKHSASLPRVGSSVGPIGVLRTEMERKRPKLSVRELLKQAGSVIQAAKPVFMMSPLSVAQFLEPGAIEFDLLIIDEASQVQPVDALGAAARSKQIVVVGDDKQLPPTLFFSRISADEQYGDEDESGAGAQDIESILGLCKARGTPERMLRWHYRSRHQSLIAVSNREFYDNQLFIVPSPSLDCEDMGLRFSFVPNAVFDRGGSATNRVEARVVASAILRHALIVPGRSLGVGTFSIRQKQAILDELEILRRDTPEAEPFFVAHSNEPFFVKNLENIQGDERDVIFISIGYGRNTSGYMAMTFGPLSLEGGERRLNVLISRAKLKCEVFSSITADDIDLERGKGRGVASLKAFLNFAEKGIIEVGQITGRDFDSPFEEEVARALVSSGYDVKRQIGIAGFFIDLAIVDPKRPGRYVIGIECDGASYHSMRSVRDRDRLRQAVLEDHGWRIHRIWSLDWFQRPEEQLKRTIGTIEAAIADGAAASATQTETSVDFDRLKRQETPNVVSEPLSVPYTEARFTVPNSGQLHEVAPEFMAALVTKIVGVEGPIHQEEIVARVRQAWGLARAGARIHGAVRAALDKIEKHGGMKRDLDFYFLPKTEVKVRDRSSVQSASLRKPSMLPPKEIDAAVLAIIDSGQGASTEELGTHVPRLLGFAASSALLREMVEIRIEALQSTGIIDQNRGMWTRAVS